MSRRYMDEDRERSPGAPVYDDAHRAFLQAFFANSVFTNDTIKPVVASILQAQEPDRPRLEGDITEATINSLIQNTNAQITPFDFEIRSARDQSTQGKRTYALVNTASDTFTQLATSFTPDEIAYIKRLLDAMFEENNTRSREVMAVKKMRATQLTKAPARNRQSQAATQLEDDAEATQVEASAKSINHTDSERVLQTLVSQGFFQLSHRLYYSLAPRGLLELRSYLKETYNEQPAEDDDEEEPVIRIRDCEGCQDIVTVGLRCNNRDCGVRWHERCANQYFGGQPEGARRCPKCKTEFSGTTYVGEKADRVQDTGSSAGRRSNMRAQEEEDLAEGDDE